jgi:hypothetical protein
VNSKKRETPKIITLKCLFKSKKNKIGAVNCGFVNARARATPDSAKFPVLEKWSVKRIINITKNEVWPVTSTEMVGERAKENNQTMCRLYSSRLS